VKKKKKKMGVGAIARDHEGNVLAYMCFSTAYIYDRKQLKLLQLGKL
jgi:isoaspartyl peptidase/L-asparaginase-like protein (Ntn-hydrolase superfamily)